MLPPVDFSNNTCVGGNAGILYWDGATTIKCIPGSSGDAGGDISATGEVTANSLLLSGATGVLNSRDADTLIQLNTLGDCSPDQLLTKNEAGQFVCQTYINAASLGTYAFPSCPGGALNWDDTGNPATSGFVCYTPAAPPAPTPPVSNIACAGGSAVTSFSGGQAVCGPVVGASCPLTFPNSGDPAPPTASGALGFDSWASGFCVDNPAELENDVYLCQSNGSWGFITATELCE